VEEWLKLIIRYRISEYIGSRGLLDCVSDVASSGFRPLTIASLLSHMGVIYSLETQLSPVSDAHLCDAFKLVLKILLFSKYWDMSVHYKLNVLCYISVILDIPCTSHWVGFCKSVADLHKMIMCVAFNISVPTFRLMYQSGPVLKLTFHVLKQTIPKTCTKIMCTKSDLHSLFLVTWCALHCFAVKSIFCCN